MAGAPEQPDRTGPPEGVPQQHRCRLPEDVIPDTLAWDPNRCATFFAVPVAVTADLPGWHTERANLLARGKIGLGDIMLETLFPVRMVGYALNCPPWLRGPNNDATCNRMNGADPDGEMCAHYWGALTTDEAGEGMGVFGSNPEQRGGINDFPNETAVCHVMVMTEERIAAIPGGSDYLKPGDAVLVGGYRTPPVVEAHFHSPLRRCGSKPI